MSKNKANSENKLGKIFRSVNLEGLRLNVVGGGTAQEVRRAVEREKQIEQAEKNSGEKV